MPRILCLPGFLQSGSVFAEKSSGLRKILTKKLHYELDYLDPPIIIERKEQLQFPLSADPNEASEKWSKIIESNANRCWWLSDSKGNNWGFETAVQHVVEHISKNGPYDGIMGFSQGAAMSLIITNCLGRLLPSHGPFALAILFSPFAFTLPKNPHDEMNTINQQVTDVKEYAELVQLNPQLEKYFIAQDIPTKIIAVYGTVDAIVPPVRTQYLCKLFPSIQTITHDGGHYMPNKKSFLNPILEICTNVLSSKSAL